MPALTRFRIFASLLLSATLCPSQMTMPPQPAASDARLVVLVDGLGNSHHVIRTANPQAQRYFDQGMDYLFAFNHDEARRSFAKAAELDPHAAMPLWGVALAVGPNYNDIDIGHAREQAAFEAISKARKLAAGGPAIEADYVDALAARFGEDTKHDLHVQGERYATAMAALVAKHPDDLDAATLYAEAMMDLHPWQLWTPDGKPGPGTETIVATLQSVILRDPNHVGANHFLIHAVEASPDPSLALASADRLKTLAPAAGHLVHMPAHIYQRVGDFEDSAEANRHGIAADQAYFAAQSTHPAGEMYYDMYYVHNIHFLASACSMEGNAECTTKAAQQLVDYVAPAVAKDKVVEWFMPTQPWMLVRFNRWNDILAASPAPQGLSILADFWHYARGSAYTALKQPEQAQKERNALAAAIQSLPADIPPDFNNPAKTALELSLTVLDARMAEARGDRTHAIALWKQAVATLDTFAYNEPADWYYPVRESLGGALLRNGQPAEAEAVFRRDLEKNPGSGRSLFGLWQSLVLEHRPDDAAFVKTQFDEAWKHATITLRVEDL
jgi:tetratricopeptide (TPR) repeat protein